MGQVHAKELLPPAGWETDPYGFGFLGRTVTTVGDVDGDALPDLAVGTREGVLIFAGATGTPSTSLTWHPDDGTSYAYDLVISAAGDIDADGYADFVVGGSPEGEDAEFRVYYGQPGGPTLANSFSTTLRDVTDPPAVAGVGDVNGDSYDDIAVGDLFAEQVYVYYGSSVGISRSPGTVLLQPEDGASFGKTLAGGGDLNGDGFDDILVGDPGYDSRRGWAGLFLGGSAGVATEATQSWLGDELADYYGTVINVDGDFNIDGYADLVIGAPAAAGNIGTVSIYMGGATVSTSPAIVLLGGESGESFGESLAVIGDTDLDGRPDLAIGAPDATGERGRASADTFGRVEAYAGSSAGVEATPTQSFLGPTIDSCLGNGLGAAGDFNNDGCADAALADSCRGNGTVYVYWGYGDKDGDGAIICGGTDTPDCNDTDATVFPGAPEICDGKDNNCNGEIDEPGADGETRWYADTDGDGYGDPDNSVVSCQQPDGYVTDSTDCDDDNAAVNPAATEVCNGIDDDCNGVVDGADAVDATTWYVDTDGDGYGDTPVTDCVQPDGSVDTPGDCDDADPEVNPGATEVCDDAIDNDCDGSTDADDADCSPSKYIWEGGCGCATSGRDAPLALIAAAAAMLVVRRRGQRS